MVVDGVTSTSEVIAALADLAPGPEERATSLTVPLEYFRWLPLGAAELFNTGALEGSAGVPAARVTIERDLGERLAAIAQIRTLAQPIRVGWLFVAGRVSRGDGTMQRVLHPLVTVPVRVVRMPLSRTAELAAAGDVALSDLIAAGPKRLELEGAIEYGGGAFAGSDTTVVWPAMLTRLTRLQAFAAAATEAAGFPSSALVAAGDNPDDYFKRTSLVVVVGAAVYLAQETGGSAVRPASELGSNDPTSTCPRFVRSISVRPTGQPPRRRRRPSSAPFS